MSDFEPASRLVDRQVEDVNGNLVGRVEDLLVDTSSGQIEYVLITIPPDGSQTDPITIPWSLIVINTRKRRRWRVSVNKSALERLIVGQYRR